MQRASDLILANLLCCHRFPYWQRMQSDELRRRELIRLFGGAAAAWPIAARAQQPAKVARIGHLDLGPASARASRVEALRAGLRDLGYVQGKNVVIEFRWADGVQQLPEIAAELVRMNVDVIFAPSSTMIEAARQATKTVPIVFANHSDPIGTGHVASLSRPGGNITGLSELTTELNAKALEILNEAVPRATRIGVLWNPTTPSHVPGMQSVEAAGKRLGLEVYLLSAATVEDFDAAFVTMERENVGGVFIVPAPITLNQRARLAELALKHRLPTIFGPKDNVEAGGLMSYGPDRNDLIRRAAVYIDKILKGAKPADLPVEQASKYQLVINLKTAKALGLEIPPTLLARTDEVIE
jgi:putative tryptophan/tyrosine transport system substrate-binding protein